MTCPAACAGAGNCLTAVGIAAGTKHTCALMSDNSVYCWGDNGALQLGVTGPILSTVALHTTIVADRLVLGGNTGCTLSISGAIACWGSNSNGQLGVMPSALAASATPRTIGVTTSAFAGDVLPLALGAAHACALPKSGPPVCWGRGLSGQVADATLPAAAYIPNPVPAATGALYVGAGGDSTCVAFSSSFSCWGANGSRQLGSAAGNVPMTATPQSNNVGGMLSGLWMGGAHGCFIANSGGRCWGDNVNGQDGANASPTTFTYLAPSNIKGSNGVPFPGIFALGNAHSCLRQLGGRTGEIVCAGADTTLGQVGDDAGVDQLEFVPTTLGRATHVAAGGDHTCAVLNDGTVACWGANDRGQLGDGTMTTRTTPVTVKF
jgi:alpha-tubulin suppressor-like RCC1 family protein